MYYVRGVLMHVVLFIIIIFFKFVKQTDFLRKKKNKNRVQKLSYVGIIKNKYVLIAWEINYSFKNAITMISSY